MSASDYIKNLRVKIGRDLLMLPSVAAIIRDDSGRILLQGKAENVWSLPAGAIEPGESPAQAVVREVWEETGLTIRPQHIAGVFGGIDGFRFEYSNGDLVEYTVIVFECETVGGVLSANDSETLKLKYFSPDKMPELPIKYPHDLFLRPNKKPYFQFESS